MLQDARDNELKFSKITLEELTSSQYHDRFFSDICRRLNEVEKLSLAHDDNGILIRLISTNLKTVIPHSVKQLALVLIHYPVTASDRRGLKLYCGIK